MAAETCVGIEVLTTLSALLCPVNDESIHLATARTCPMVRALGLMLEKVLPILAVDAIEGLIVFVEHGVTVLVPSWTSRAADHC